MDSVRRRQAASRLAQKLVNLPGFRAARRVALFLPADGEIDPRAAGAIAARQGKRLYLPYLRPGRNKTLGFIRYRPGQPLRLNRYGIHEPPRDPCHTIAPRQLDLVILPLVGFDERGHRLGMGGGFYDRSFAFVRPGWRGRRPQLLGVAFEQQRVDELPADPWDVPLDAVITEQGIYCFRKRSRA